MTDPSFGYQDGSLFFFRWKSVVEAPLSHAFARSVGSWKCHPRMRCENKKIFTEPAADGRDQESPDEAVGSQYRHGVQRSHARLEPTTAQEAEEKVQVDSICILFFIETLCIFSSNEFKFDGPVDFD